MEFNWKEKSNQNLQFGFIAQELEKVCPNLVSENEYKTIDYMGLIGVLVEGVKEQQKQIDELKKIIKLF